MRNIVNISLPTNLSTVVDEAMTSGNYASKSDFFRSLLKMWMESKIVYEVKQSHKELKNGKGKLLKSLKDLR